MIGAALLLAVIPSPTTTTKAPLDADLVTPGLWGFVLLFFLALAVYVLGRSMARRVRRVNQRVRVEAELAEVGTARVPGEPGPAANPTDDDEDPAPGR